MGFNTVAFLLNDFMHTLKDSPKSVLFKLAHPPMSEDDKGSLNKQVDSVARESGERPPHSQALEVLPTFHADEQRFFVAGGNCIKELKCVRLGTTKDGKKTVTLELPDWFEPRWYLPNRPKKWPKRK